MTDVQRSLSDTFQTFPEPEELSRCVTWDVLHSALLRDTEHLQQVGHREVLNRSRETDVTENLFLFCRVLYSLQLSILLVPADSPPRFLSRIPADHQPLNEVSVFRKSLTASWLKIPHQSCQEAVVCPWWVKPAAQSAIWRRWRS